MGLNNFWSRNEKSSAIADQHRPFFLTSQFGMPIFLKLQSYQQIRTRLPKMALNLTSIGLERTQLTNKFRASI